VKKRDRASSLFWAAFGLVFAVSAWRQGLILRGVPGPGFLPFICGIALFFLSAIVFVRSLAAGDGPVPEGFFTGQGGLRKVVCTLAALLAYAVCLPYLGFLLTTFAFSLVTFRLGEQQKWLRVVALSLAIAIVAYLLFSALDVQLPLGILEFLQGSD
jgi:putative tricarboxylic transport membrane protein